MIASLRWPTRARLLQLATGHTASIGVGVAATNILRIVSSMTLTRLLDAYAFGVVGVITSVAFMLTMVTDVGLAPFVVRHPDGDDRAFLDELWTIRIIRGFGLALLMAVVAFPMASFLGKPELGLVVVIWGVSFILDGFQSMAHVTAIRHKQLWRLSLLDLTASVATFAVSLSMAFLLHSYWAMIIGMFGGALARLIFSYTLFPQAARRWLFNLSRGQELWRFSRFIAMSSILALLILQLDKVVLARLLPLPIFGLYAIAVTLATAPSALASPYASRVLFAVYAEAVRARHPALRRLFYNARRKVALLYMFATSGIIGAAPLIVAVLYDPRYAGVVPFLRLIAISVVLRLPSLAADQMLIALGRTRVDFYANVCRFTWLAIGGAVGLVTGNILLLVAIVGTVEVPGLICNWVFLRRERLLDLREEGYGFAAAAAGLGVGYIVSEVAIGLFPHL